MITVSARSVEEGDCPVLSIVHTTSDSSIANFNRLEPNTELEHETDLGETVSPTLEYDILSIHSQTSFTSLQPGKQGPFTFPYLKVQMAT